MARPVGRTSRSIDFADVAATFLFAAEGAGAGARYGLDLLGTLVVGFSTALAGGILRDLLLGEHPPAALRSPLRIIVALGGGLTAFYTFALVTDGTSTAVLTALDAAALALFAVAGAAKAIEYRMTWLVVILLGTVTAVGGGVARDILLNRTPLVLTQDFYASAAILGIGAMLIARTFRVPLVATMWIGFLVCLTLRLLAAAYDWHLPTAT